jgi:hypothetical protein
MAKKHVVSFEFCFVYSQAGMNELPDTKMSDEVTENMITKARDMLDRSIKDALGIKDCDTTFEFTHS